MIVTTLRKIRAAHPCEPGWERLLRALNKTKADDELLPLELVLDSNGVNDAIWCLRAVDGVDNLARLFAVACARRVQHLLPNPRLWAAFDVAERYAMGEASDDELADACADVADIADTNYFGNVAFAVTRPTFAAAATAAAFATVVLAANAANNAADDDCFDAAKDDERAWQAEEFRRLCRREGRYA